MKLLLLVSFAFVGCGGAVRVADTDGGYVAPASPTLMMLPGEIQHDPGPGTDPPPSPPSPAN